MDEPAEPWLQDLVGDDRYYEEVESRLEDANEVDELGHTLLHIASWSRKSNPRIVKLLLERGADVNSAGRHELTPLHFAVSSRKRFAVDAFIEAGADVNKDSYGRTALHFSIGSYWSRPPVPAFNLPCDMWIVRRLLCHPEIDLNPTDAAGCTPLMWAVHRRNAHAVKELLKKGANPNIPNKNGRTNLHRVLTHFDPNFRIADSLLQNGADIYCKDKFGKTPIDMLVENVEKNQTFAFANRVVWLIALRYRIEESLEEKLKRIPQLYEHFENCLREVILMNSQVIYDKFTLHDLALNCYQTRFFDNNQDVSTPVVPLLLSGTYIQYLNFLIERM